MEGWWADKTTTIDNNNLQSPWFLDNWTSRANEGAWWNLQVIGKTAADFQNLPWL